MTPAQITTRAGALLGHFLAHTDRAPEAAVELGRWLAEGGRKVSPEVLAARQAECNACDAHKPLPGDPTLRYCAECKCTDWKQHLPSARCWRGRWAA